MTKDISDSGGSGGGGSGGDCIGDDTTEENTKFLNDQSKNSNVNDDNDQSNELVKKDGRKSVTIAVSSKNGKQLKPKKPIDDEPEYEMVPPDGGWGWLILAGSMLVNILVPGTVKSFGVLFVEFLEAFDATPAEAAWIPALCYFLYSSLGPLSSILSVKYSYRTVTLIGGTFAAVGMMISYFASSVPYLYVSYGVLVGTGAGLSFPPTVYIVTSYFVKLRGLANGICISGSAFGSIILPPILRYLLETYGYRGAVLIMGGITLNTWVAAIFYEPVEKHLKRVLKKPAKDLDALTDGELSEEDEDEEGDNGIEMQFKKIGSGVSGGGGGDESTVTGVPATVKNENENKRTRFDSNSSDTKEQLTPVQRASKYRKNKQNNGFTRSASAAVMQNYKLTEEQKVSRQRKISTPIRQISQENNGTANMNSTPSLYAAPSSRFSYSKLSRLNQLRNSEGLSKRSPSTSSFQYISTPYHGSTLAFQPAEFSSHLSLKSIASTVGTRKTITEENDEEKTTGCNRFLDLSLLKDAAYLVVLISNSTNAISYTNFIILLPSYAGALGFDKNYAAYLLSIVSMLDLVGRIGGSALSDWTNFIPKTWYFVGGLAISGVSLAALPQATSYGMVSFWCGLFGLASGTYVGITAVIMADMLGTERLTSTYGISLFVNGILQLIGPPLCGLWFQQVGTYVPLFTTLGIVLLCGASLWGFMPIIHRNRRRKQRALDAQARLEDVIE